MIWLEWTCPHCGASNEDSPDETDLPVCPQCNQESYWDHLDNVRELVLR